MKRRRAVTRREGMVFMKGHSLSHMGLVRTNNEDRYLLKKYGDGSILMAVADGMGGHAAGELAAQAAADTISEFDTSSKDIEAHLVHLVLEAGHRIIEQTLKDTSIKGMGTTLTANFVKEGIARWVHVGDTRLYLFRTGKLSRITDDHTIPGTLLKDGELTEEGARLHPLRNMLLKCVGCEEAQPDTGSFDIRPGDILMISSDGLHDAIPDYTIASVLGSVACIEDKLDSLIQAALAEGGRDNITVVAVEL